MKGTGAGEAMDDITVVDFDRQIKEEIRLLRAQLALLLQEKEELLYHVCPELLARYAREVGSYENRAHYQEYLILELKRRIELARAALNREQTISKEAIDKQIEIEYRAFHEKVEEERRRAEQAQRTQAERERRRRESEQRWQARYGSGAAEAADQNSAEGHPKTADGKCVGEDAENSSRQGDNTETDSTEDNGKTREDRRRRFGKGCRQHGCRGFRREETPQSEGTLSKDYQEASSGCEPQCNGAGAGALSPCSAGL